MTVTVRGVCAETESWRRDTVFHELNMHPPGTAMANPTCLVSWVCPEDVMYTVWGNSYDSRFPSIDLRKELTG